MENKKLINNSSIICAKQNIRDVINREIQNGIPISVIHLIVDSCFQEIDALLNKVLDEEDRANQECETTETETIEPELVE